MDSFTRNKLRKITFLTKKRPQFADDDLAMSPAWVKTRKNRRVVPGLVFSRPRREPRI
jgi:hypothetical protein